MGIIDDWPVKATDPPKLTTEQWSAVSLLGIILFLMALFQLISFSDFRDSLNDMGLAGPTAWAVLIILAELFGAAGFFRWRLSHLFRVVSASAALLVGAFWFVENVQIIANGMPQDIGNSAFFGRFLAQTPGWWTVIEVSLLLFWAVYAVGLVRPALMAVRRR